jgi:hypothetical protein
MAVLKSERAATFREARQRARQGREARETPEVHAREIKRLR